MKKITSLLFTISVALCLLSSCRSTKKIQTVITPKKDTLVVDTPPVVNLRDDSVAFMAETYKSIMATRIDFATFSAKIDVDYEDAEGKKYNVNAHVRMHKDSIIWISITGPLGIEGIRAFITRDSVRLLDKQNKTYVARSVSFLQEVTELPLDLSSLQDLLVGNPVFFGDNLIAYSNSAETITILGNGNFFKSLYTIDAEKKLPLSAKLDDIGESKNRTCYLVYDDYKNKKGVNFSEKRSINVAEKKKLDIKLNFKQYEFNETLSFPFSIPKNYKRE